MAIIIKKASTELELQGILDLQQQNLRTNISEDEMEKYGFVTLSYDMPFLKAQSAGNHHIIAVLEGEVVGYVLLMDRSSNHLMTTGSGVFPIFNALTYKGRLLGDINYVSVGQVCVDRNQAGQGLLKRMYDYYKVCYENVYDLAMTDIAIDNHRSIRGHVKSGFEVIHEFYEPDAKETWVFVVWDWRK